MAYGDLVLTVDDQEFTGWTDVRVTLGIERCPNDFVLGFTGRDSKSASVAKPQDACKIGISTGDNSVVLITGFVDGLFPAITPENHSLSIRGRGKCQDIVDCAAKYPEGSFRNMTLAMIASALCLPFGISVTINASPELANRVIPSFPLMYGETVMEVLERLAKYLQLLIIEDSNGNLLLSQIGTEVSGTVEQGKNVQSGSAAFTADKLFSEYNAYLNSIDNFNDISGHEQALKAIPSIVDSSVNRYRPMIFIVDTGDANWQVAQSRMIWEKNRRQGRSNSVRVEVDSWFASKGKPWKPNTLVNAKIPDLYVGNESMYVQWIIGEVTFIKNEQRGTVAELVLMPPEAFSVRPIVFIQNQFPEYARPPQ